MHSKQYLLMHPTKMGLVIASEAKQSFSRGATSSDISQRLWIASSLRSSQ
jgi:hypothetical protein